MWNLIFGFACLLVACIAGSLAMWKQGN